MIENKKARQGCRAELEDNMANNGFDTAHLPERRGSRSVKWDTMATKYGREDLIPLWVADMDYPCSG